MEPYLQAIKQHYKMVRLGWIERQEQQAQTIRQRLKQRQGFFKLSEDKVDRVLGYVRKAAYNTTNVCIRLVYDWKKYSEMS